jgi:MFS family permease
MTTVAHAPPAAVPQTSTHDKVLFWGCFIALVTTSFGFITRVFLIDIWSTEFNLDAPKAGRLLGIGLWPFAVSIIGFSLVIDKIGYKMSMVIAFLGHIIWAVMGVGAFFLAQNQHTALAYDFLFWGSLILALGNGTVESFINPVVATMFSREKTKWLNILHAGWPGGLVLAGILTITIANVPWWIKVGLIAIPAVVYFLMLMPLRFPVQERVASGVSYRDMLSEFGVLGAAIVGCLVTLQLMDFFAPMNDAQRYLFIAIGIAIVVAFGLYTRSIGRFLMFFLIMIMMPLATTEIGTDGWITAIMKTVVTFDAGWILVYTSAIMLVLRFFAGPIVHQLSPLGLLAASAALAIVGLYTLSFAAGTMIFIAATLYGFGKTFFWPTMLGVVSEQMPKGGALTLNAISGIGMLAVGTLGMPYIGTLQAKKEINAVASSEVAKLVPGLIQNGKLTAVEDKSIYEILHYQTLDMDKVKSLLTGVPRAGEVEVKLKDISNASKQGALADMIVFPAVMLMGYLLLIGYFKARGGYKAEVLVGHKAVDEKFTGGVEGAVEG